MTQLRTMDIMSQMHFGYCLAQREHTLFKIVEVNQQFLSWLNLTEEVFKQHSLVEMLSHLNQEIDWVNVIEKIEQDKPYVQTIDHMPFFFKVELKQIDDCTIVLLLHDETALLRLEENNMMYSQVFQRQSAISNILQIDIDDPDSFVREVLTQLMTMLNAKMAVLRVFETDKNEDWYTWTDEKHLNQYVKEGIIQELNTNLNFSHIQNSKQPYFCNEMENILEDGSFLNNHVQNILLVPIIKRGVCVAHFGIFNRDEGFNQFDANQMFITLRAVWLLKDYKDQLLINSLEQVQRNQVFDQVPLYICEFDEFTNLKYVNQRYIDHVGLSREEMIGRPFLNFVDDVDYDQIQQGLKSLSKENLAVQYTQRNHKPHQVEWIEWLDMAILNDLGEIHTYYSLGLDVSDRQNLDLKQQEELNFLRTLISSHKAMMMFINPETGYFVDVNPAACHFYGYSKDELLKMRVQDINMFPEGDVSYLLNEVTKESQEFTSFPHRIKSGEIRMVNIYSSPIQINEETVLFAIVFDVTDRDEAMKKINHHVYHDYLTGLYNRRYFEESYGHLNSKEHYPLGVLLADINGLKLINDNYGHILGDFVIKEAVNHIKKHLPEVDVFARSGGDEFVILISESNASELESLSDYLEKVMELEIEHPQTGVKIYLSVSFGHAIQKKAEMSLDILTKAAESILQTRKVYNVKSSRSHMINAMMSTLFQKSERERNHSIRVANYCVSIAEHINMSKEQINRLNIAATLHDIGKIVIDEKILNKCERLTLEEWAIMRVHPSKGARILEEIEEYKDIANIVEAHHERYDGRGYPFGLKEEDIPLESRIIAVADAFDAMTQFRTYRDAISFIEALEELKRGAGTQFDERIVEVFLLVMANQHQD